MRKAVVAIGLASLMTGSGLTQKPVIEVRKVRTLIDRDGKGFTRAPFSAEAIPGGRYALSETNETPLVVDSTGRLLKRFRRGEGPGEFEVPGTSFRLAAGDTLWAPNGGKINLFDRDLKFIRAIPLTGVYAGTVLPMQDGFIVVSPKNEPPAHQTSVHVMNAGGALVRSFVRDTFDRRAWPQPSYRVAQSTEGKLWIASAGKHRLEKWTIDGRREAAVDTAPAWFDARRTIAEGKPYVVAAREANGVLWVMSSVPVPDYREQMAKAVGRARGEVDARAIPVEQLFTAYLAAYDAATGRLLADLPLKKYGVALLGQSQLMVYTPGPSDEANLEIWEMRLRR